MKNFLQFLKELILALLNKSAKPEPKPAPEPIKPDPVPTPQPKPDPKPDHIIIADLQRLPDIMTQAGFVGRWTAQCYALANSYAGVEWDLTGADQEVLDLYVQREAIDKWFEEKYIQPVEAQLKKWPDLTATIIINDGHDRLGFRLGDAIWKRLEGFRERLTMGEIYKYV